MPLVQRGIQSVPQRGVETTRGTTGAPQKTIADEALQVRGELRARRQKLVDQSFAAQAEREFLQRTAQAQLEARKNISADGAGYGSSLNKAYDGIIGDIEKRSGQDVSTDTTAAVLDNLRTRAVRQNIQDNRFEHSRSVTHHTEIIKDDIFKTARRAADSNESLELLTAEIDQKLDGLLEASENDENLFRDTGRRARIEMIGAHVEGRIDREPFKVYQELKDGEFDKVLDDPVARNRLAGEALREHKRRKAEYERQQKQIAAAIKAEADDIEEALSIGAPISDERIEGLRNIAGTAGNDVLQAVETTISIAKEAKELFSLSPKEGDDYVSQVRNISAGDGDTSAVEVERIKTLTRAVDTKRARLNSDIVASGVAEGKIEPLDFSTFNPFAISDRIASAQSYASLNGKEPEYLTKDERDQLASRIEADDDGFNIAVDLARSKSGEFLLREIFPKNQNFVHLANLKAQGASDTFIEDAKLGFNLTKQEGFSTRVHSQTAKESASSVIGSGLNVLPETENAIVRNARAAYEVRAQREGLTGTQDDFDNKLYERLLNEAAGATFDVRGKQIGGFTNYKSRGVTEKVLLPAWMPEKSFRKAFKGLTASQMRRASGSKGFAIVNGNVVAMSEENILRGTPVQESSGRYAIMTGDPSEPEWVRNKDGGVYILDLNVLKSELLK